MKAFHYQWGAFFFKEKIAPTTDVLHSERTERFIPHDHGNAKNLEFRVKVQRFEEMSTSIDTVDKKSLAKT